MKELMVTLLILSCTGMVCAQQDYGSTTRSSNNTSSVSNNGNAPVVPIVSADDSTSATGSGTRAATERTRPAFATSQNTENSSSIGGLSSRDSQPLVRKNFPERATGITRDTGFARDPSVARDFGGVARTSGLARETGLPRETGLAREPSLLRETGLANRTQQTTANPSADKVIYLGLPASQLTNLQKYGSVEAEVRNPFVDRITISDQDRPKATPVRTIEPVLRGDKLVFSFNETQLGHLDDYSFEFNVPAYMKGKYTKAVIEYPPALRAQSTQNNQLASQSAPRLGTGFQSEDQRWRLAGQQLPRDTSNLLNIRPVSATTGQLDIERQRQLDLERQIQLERDRSAELERLTYQQQLRDQEARQQTSLADRNRQLEDQLSRLRYEQEQATNRARQWQTPVTPVAPPRFADQSFDPISNRRYDTVATYPAVQTPVISTSTTDKLAVSLIEKEMERMEARIAQLNFENRQLDGQVNAVKGENNMLRERFNNNDYRPDLVNRDRIQGTTNQTAFGRAPTLPERPVMSTGGFDPAPNSGQSRMTHDRKDRSNQDTAATSARKRSSWDLLMLLMLLASVALNLYLWAVSRGFYMRYQELADELRETFAVTT